MGLLLRIAGVFDSIARSAGRISSWIVLPLIFTIMFDVITRKIDYTRLYFSDLSIEYGGFSVSTILQDMQWHFHAVLMMMTFGIAYLANAHVRVDIFRELMPKSKQAWIEIIGLLVLGIPFAIVMISESYQLTELAFNQGEGSESLTGIGKRWIIKSFVLIGFVVLFLAMITTLFRCIAFLFGTDEQSIEANQGLLIFPEDAGELEAARMAAERALEEEIEDAAELAEKLAAEKKAEKAAKMGKRN